MISAQTFCDELDARGFTLASGVPCSYFAGPIALLSRRGGGYVPAANEGGALAIAVGATLAGGRAYVMLQNSGLGNLLNPLTSLVMSYQAPMLAFVSLRGFPDPTADEPQHEVMGRTTHALLDAVGVDRWTLRADGERADLCRILDEADATMAAGGPAFVLVEKGAVGRAEVCPAGRLSEALDSREVMEVVVATAAGCPLVASTGYVGRELFGVEDRALHFYMQGSMGHAAAIALGIASQDVRRPVVVVEGDGAALMHLGTMSVIGSRRDVHLVHVVLDNGMHESTGGQATTSASTSFAAMALAAGYASAADCRDLHDVGRSMKTMLATRGVHLCAIPTRPRQALPGLPRVTSTIDQTSLRGRFASAISRVEEARPGPPATSRPHTSDTTTPLTN